MTRKEQIKQVAEEFADHEHSTMRDVSMFNLLQYAFKCGAKWTDEHPISLVHSSEEKPNSYPILCLNKFNNKWVQHDLEEDYTWEEFVKNESIINWVYITDIFLK